VNDKSGAFGVSLSAYYDEGKRPYDIQFLLLAIKRANK
jgi:hypothetical protein